MAYKTRKQMSLEIEKLQKEISKLTDENNSLWFMWDEMDRSNVANPEYIENIKEMMDSLRKARLMTHTKLEEA